MSNAIPGPGFLLQMGDGGGPETFTTIAEVKDIRGPGLKTDTTDVTNQSSPGGVEEVKPTIKRPGEITFDCNFIPTDATHDGSTGVLADWASKVLRNYKLQLNNGSSYWAFSGFVIGFDETGPVAGVLSANVTIKISGVPTLHS